MTERNRFISVLSANKPALKFLGLFAVIFGGLYLIFGLTPGVRLGLIRPYTAFLAEVVGATINLLGAGATVNDTLVQSSRFSINIVMGCDGVEASCLFAAGVLAFPATWGARLIGLALGLPAIQLINVLRLVGLYFAGVYAPSSFEELHVYVAQTIVILLSTAILIIWFDRVGIRHRRA